MKTPAILLSIYTLLAFVGMGYGFNIDRFAGLVGALPGLVGMLGMMVWAGSYEGLQAQATADHAASLKRRAQARASFYRNA